MILFPGLIGAISKVFASLSSGWNESSILSGSLAVDFGDAFGFSVAMNSTGDRVVVGAFSDERSGQTTDHNEGLAYMFVSGTGGWTQQHIFSGSLALDPGDIFGWSVAMNSTGDRVVAGARLDERSVGSSNVGLAYIFVSGTGGWTEQQIFSGSLAIDSNDFFGWSVAMNSTGDRVVVGARADERSSQTAEHNEGLAYMFVSGTGGWTQQHIFSGSQAVDGSDQFGQSVAINSTGDRVVVGARNDERSGGNAGSGLAYIFVSGTGGWTEQQIFSGSLAVDTDDNFGWSVAMNSAGDRVVVGAYQDERSSQTADHNEGLAYMFVSGTGGWTQQHIFSGSLAVDADDNFGYSVAINSAGDRVVVGAYQDERSDGSDSMGLSYMFVSGTGGWTQQHIFSGSLAVDTGDQFGRSVAMNSTGDRVVVGARLDERSGQTENQNEGLAYVFDEN